MIEGKVAAQSLSASLTGIVTYALVTYIPAWHSGLPSGVATLLPVVVSVVSGFGGGWLAKHTPRLEEIWKVLLQKQAADQAAAAAAHAQVSYAQGVADAGAGVFQLPPQIFHTKEAQFPAASPEATQEAQARLAEQRDPYAGGGPVATTEPPA